MVWKGESRRHSLARKGIKTKIPIIRMDSRGNHRAELVDFDELPDYLYHATPTKNVEKILQEGIKIGKEEARSLEFEWEEFRPVEDMIFFTETPDNANYFGIQAVDSEFKRRGEKPTKEDMDFTILRIDTEDFEKNNFIAYQGAELFGTGEREYIVRYNVPRFWIDAGERVFYDPERDTIVRDKYSIHWDGTEYKLYNLMGIF